MGRYIDDILQPGEKVLYSTNAHWIFYLPAIAAWLLAAVLLIFFRSAITSPRERRRAHPMAIQQKSPAGAPGAGASPVDPAEVAKFSKLSDEWWDPNGKMAPLHKINPLRLSYIRDAACRKFERNVKSLNCLSGLRILDIGCGARLVCAPFTRLAVQVLGVDPTATNIAAARVHGHQAH